ncbi:MAG: biopolymer transporter ExbD [Armatimonadetes bacterium]|nr:biopolymer transporter ExbD [Armatimonadota bacterium]
MRLPQREIKKARIEIVPMIDTMVFLLIFFMMASLAMTPLSSMKVNLPRAAAGEKTSHARVILTLTNRGEVYVNRQRVTLDQVTSVLRERIAANPEMQVVVNADRSLRYDQVIALMDAAKRANPRYMVLATNPQTKL